MHALQICLSNEPYLEICCFIKIPLEVSIVSCDRWLNSDKGVWFCSMLEFFVTITFIITLTFLNNYILFPLENFQFLHTEKEGLFLSLIWFCT